MLPKQCCNWHITNKVTNKNTHTNFKDSILTVRSSLYAFALKLTSDESEANDLVQETVLKALNNESKFVANDNFKGWILTIMRNIFLNNKRRANRVSNLDTDDNSMTNDLSQRYLSSPSPEEVYSVDEINSIISTFPDTYRVPFTMQVAGYKYEEIANSLNMPLGVVKSRIFHTRRRLRRILKDF